MASPQIVGHDAEIWRELIKQNVQDWEKKLREPKNPQNWFKLYEKLFSESNEQIDKDAKLLEATMKGISYERSKHKLKQVELDTVKLAGDMKRSGPTISLNTNVKFIDRGTLHDKAPSKREIKIARGELDPNAPRRTAAPKGKLDQFRKDARAIPRFQNHPKKATGVITAREMAMKQNPVTTRIVRAPRGMIEDHRQASIAKPFDPSKQQPQVINPKKRKIEHDVDQRSAEKITEEREKRLKTFTNPSSTPSFTPKIRAPKSQTPTSVSSSPTPPPPDTRSRNTAVGSFSASLPHSKAAPREPPPPKITNRASPVPPIQVSRANTSSPSNGGTRPPMILKRKAPADIFMRPTKRHRRPT